MAIQRSTILHDDSQGTATTKTVSVDINKAHAISGIGYRLEFEGTAVDATISKVSLVANGNVPLFELSHEELSDINKSLAGTEGVSDASGGTDQTFQNYYMFGASPEDVSLYLAPHQGRYKTLKLHITYDASASTAITDVKVSVWMHQMPGMPAEGVRFIRRNKVEEYAASNSLTKIVRLPQGQGNLLKAVYLEYGALANVSGGNVELGINNFSTQVVSQDIQDILDDNRLFNRYHDATAPTLFAEIDLDLNGTGRNLINTGADGIDDLQLRLRAASSGTSGNVSVITEEIVLG